ncbi:PfkB family carbohydrate kinase [Oerskovia sp. USHLN155]|uniref:PfkB family carbohydrate kinase n=1 Tax=Oerskovia sp. USHLN155 TaxID=3081288 RepID=UPI003019871D
MLICCGLTTLDITQVVHALPGPDEKVVATSQRATFGGPAANAAATAAALGVPVRLVTAIGAGMLAEVVRADVVATGVELIDVTTGGSAVPDGEARGPAVSTVLVTAGTGERAVVSTNATGRPVAAGGERAVSGVFDLVRPGCVGGRERDVLLLDGHHPRLAHALAVRARELGVLVALDGGSWKDGTAELIALCDAVVLSQDFRMPGGDVGRVLEDVAALGPGFVARSRGGAPVEVLDGVVRSYLPVPPTGAVVDTLGAGDVLHGAFAAEVSRGRSWVSALREAVAVASRSVTYEGARGWIGR